MPPNQQPPKSNQPKAKIDPRALVAHLNQQSAALQEREILAPLLPGGTIRTRLDGLLYEFKPTGAWVGWGRFRPINEREAEPIGEVMPWQRSEYLALFPALRVILLWPLEAVSHRQARPNRRAATARSEAASPPVGTWLALAYNESDAGQRFGLASGELLPVFLCDPLGGAARFERVIVRVDGKTLWFDGPDVLADPLNAEWLREAAAQPELPEKYRPGLAGSERLALLFWQIRQLELSEAANRQQVSQRPEREQREWLSRQVGQSRLEQQLRRALEKADATLHSFAETTNPDGTPGPLVVEWSERGQTYRYRSTIEPGLTVVSSGICLSGRDSDFDLTSLVSVMNEADS